MTKPKAKNGFTLIEISIVLVIIGLLAGGVLVGQDLIRAAALRSVITQKEQIESATHAFRLKYNGLPGDIPNGTSFGFSANGNNDWRVGQFPGVQYGEVWQFFKQLSEAGLMPGQYTGTNGPGGFRHAVPGTNVLASKYPNAGFTIVGPQMGTMDYTSFVIARIPGHAALFGTPAFNLFETNGPIINSTDAFFIDSKIDDGLPGAGKVIAFLWFGCPSDSNSITARYNLADTGIKCTLIFSLSF